MAQCACVPFGNSHSFTLLFRLDFIYWGFVLEFCLHTPPPPPPPSSQPLYFRFVTVARHSHYNHCTVNNGEYTLAAPNGRRECSMQAGCFCCMVTYRCVVQSPFSVSMMHLLLHAWRTQRLLKCNFCNGEPEAMFCIPKITIILRTFSLRRIFSDAPICYSTLDKAKIILSQMIHV